MHQPYFVHCPVESSALDGESLQLSALAFDRAAQCSRRAAGAHHLLLCAEARASMLRAGVLAALLALGNAQWEPEDLPVFMPDKPHELEAYEPVADKASVVLSPMAGARPCCLPPLLRLAHAGAKARGHLGSAQRLASRCLRIASSAWSTASRASSRTSRRWGS